MDALAIALSFYVLIGRRAAPRLLRHCFAPPPFATTVTRPRLGPCDTSVEWDLMAGSHSTNLSNGATARGAKSNGIVEWEPVILSNGNIAV